MSVIEHSVVAVQRMLARQRSPVYQPGNPERYPQ